ncbi:carboxypeptidase regulatory-like domain-containing protein, partial [bacterium]|nr:carboxypeptidase regulatory-like domain-containing protein [bacterium]
INLLSGSFINQDVMLNPEVTFVPLAGAVTWGPEPVSQILVAAWSLSRGTIDSTWTAEDGCYRFEQLLAPDNYLVEASGDGFSPISIGPIFLTTPGAEWNLKFPRGQICWLITGENEILLPGVQIRLSGTGVDTCLYTDPSGTCQTSAHLREGFFLVSISPDADHLPVVPYRLRLESDQNYLDPVNLAVRHTPWPADSSFSVGEDVPICARVYSPEESTQVHHYYRGPDDLDFIGVEMMPQGKRSSLLEKQRTAIRTESQTTASDVLYCAAIPGQPVSGTLEYFIEARHGDHLFTRRSDPYQMTISNRGVLYRAGISPEEKQLQTEMPYIFLVQTYDDQGNNLSDQFVGKDVVWTVLEGPGEIKKSMQDPTQATYVSHEDGAARIGATVTQGEITVSAQALVTTQAAVLGHLEILGPAQPDISNQSQASLRCVAQDTSGRQVTIWPQWDFQPQGAGTMARSLNGDKVTFVPNPDFIGQVRIFLADSLSGRTAEYNA